MPPDNYWFVKFEPARKFGIEWEFAADNDLRSFLKQCIEGCGEQAEVSEWRHDNDNPRWVCKTDSSCGYEVASKVLGSNRSTANTLADLDLAVEVCKAFRENNCPVDNRCGLHVHVSCHDLDNEAMKNLLAYWVKFEYFISNMLPARRKENDYCRRHSGSLTPNEAFDYETLLHRGFRDRRYALNPSAYHSRGTMEFRVFEGTTNEVDLRNWLRFLFHLVDSCKILPDPPNLNFLTMEESLYILGLLNEDQLPEQSRNHLADHLPDMDTRFRIQDPQLVELRNWILRRIKVHANYPQDRDKLKARAAKPLEFFDASGNE